jgi:hypothetical protein
MQTMREAVVMLAVFNLGGGEIILILALVLILFGADKLPPLARRLWDSTHDDAEQAGRSAGGIYGKRAAQALTPDNTVAELYDPGVLQRGSQGDKRPNGFLQVFLELWLRIWERMGRK